MIGLRNVRIETIAPVEGNRHATQHRAHSDDACQQPAAIRGKGADREPIGVELTKRPVGCAIVGLLLGAMAAGSAAAASSLDPQFTTIAHEARQVIAVIDSFYARHHACPQPSIPAELAELQGELGDGYSTEQKGQFVVIGGISMAVVWLYYTSLQHPDKCTLWRKLGWDPALIWQRHREGAKWVFDPGDGSEQRTIKLAP